MLAVDIGNFCFQSGSHNDVFNLFFCQANDRPHSTPGFFDGSPGNCKSFFNQPDTIFKMINAATVKCRIESHTVTGNGIGFYSAGYQLVRQRATKKITDDLATQFISGKPGVIQ